MHLAWSVVHQSGGWSCATDFQARVRNVILIVLFILKFEENL